MYLIAEIEIWREKLNWIFFIGKIYFNDGKAGKIVN